MAVNDGQRGFFTTVMAVRMNFDIDMKFSPGFHEIQHLLVWVGGHKRGVDSVGGQKTVKSHVLIPRYQMLRDIEKHLSWDEE